MVVREVASDRTLELGNGAGPGLGKFVLALMAQREATELFLPKG